VLAESHSVKAAGRCPVFDQMIRDIKSGKLSECLRGLLIGYHVTLAVLVRLLI